MDIISEMKKYSLIGRSGSCFPTALKWEIVKNTKSKHKYIICNGSEGEPGVNKDGYILKHYPEHVINGINIALKTIDHSYAYIYLRKDYLSRFSQSLKKLIGSHPIHLVKKQGGYLGGEETAVCEVIEGRKAEPRIKPPYPATQGLFGCPTLINNVETFYCVSKIYKGEYKNTKFYCISGDVQGGIFDLPEDWTIEKILKHTGNYPRFDFFVQSGGGGVGEILLVNELNKKVEGIGAIIVVKKSRSKQYINNLMSFFLKENCDKCVPCREGVIRIAEMMNKGIDEKALDDILFVMKKTSLCPLGKCLVIPIKSMLKLL